MTLTCQFPSAPRSCTLSLQRGLLSDSKLLTTLLAPLAPRFAIITDTSVRALYGEPLQQTLCQAGLQTEIFSFPAGELSKTRKTKETLEDQLLSNAFGKDTCILALGGGVVTDLAGYLAATYCRGIPLVLIPTTLLAMIDASIGGKTGVNTPYGKNLIGCIYQPKQILIDPMTLMSLPLRELRSGIVEMIKHALMADASLFSYLETHVDALLALQPQTIDFVILQNCRIKKEIVEEDEHETGKRHLLNLGHTAGHALEHLTDYALSHGEAIALGLLIEADLAVQPGTFYQKDYHRIECLLKRYGIPLHLPACVSEEAFLQALILDKKTRKGQPRFVILNGIGSVLDCKGAYCTTVDETLIRNAFQKVLSCSVS